MPCWFGARVRCRRSGAAAGRARGVRARDRRRGPVARSGGDALCRLVLWLRRPEPRSDTSVRLPCVFSATHGASTLFGSAACARGTLSPCAIPARSSLPACHAMASWPTAQGVLTTVGTSPARSHAVNGLGDASLLCDRTGVASKADQIRTARTALRVGDPCSNVAQLSAGYCSLVMPRNA